MSATDKSNMKQWNKAFNNVLGIFFYISLLKVSSCNLSEGRQWYFHQYIESTAVQCKFTSDKSSVRGKRT